MEAFTDTTLWQALLSVLLTEGEPFALRRKATSLYASSVLQEAEEKEKEKARREKGEVTVCQMRQLRHQRPLPSLAVSAARPNTNFKTVRAAIQHFHLVLILLRLLRRLATSSESDLAAGRRLSDQQLLPAPLRVIVLKSSCWRPLGTQCCLLYAGNVLTLL